MDRRILQKLIWIVPILALLLSTLPVAAQKLPHNFGDRFAAIAYSPSDGRWGNSYEYKSEAKANRTALGHCRNSGGRSCKVSVRVANGCGAIARTGKYRNFAAATGKTKSAAFANAMQRCRNHYGSNCRIEVWACTSG